MNAESSSACPKRIKAPNVRLGSTMNSTTRHDNKVSFYCCASIVVADLNRPEKRSRN